MTPALPRTHQRPRLHERRGVSVETSLILGCTLSAIVIAWCVNGHEVLPVGGQ